MVAHQGIGVDADPVAGGDFGQQFAVKQRVFGIDEGGASMHATLRNVKRNASDEQAWTTRFEGARAVG